MAAGMSPVGKRKGQSAEPVTFWLRSIIRAVPGNRR